MNKLEMINLLHDLYSIFDQINALSGNKVSTKFKYVQSDLRDLIKVVENRIQNFRD